jgi:hypothetical protein
MRKRGLRALHSGYIGYPVLGLTMSASGIEAFQHTPVGNSSSLAVSPNISQAIRSITI